MTPGPSQQIPPSLAPPSPEAQPRGLQSNSFDDFEGLPEARWGPAAVALGALALIFVQLTLTIIVSAFYPDILEPEGQKVNQLILGLSLAGTAFAFALYEGGGRIRDALARLGITRIVLRLLTFAALGWLAYFVISIPLSQLLQPEQQDVTEALGTDEGSVISVIVAGLLIVVLAPIAEELFFRGFVFAGLRRAMPIWPAIVLSAVIFGSLHLVGGDIGVGIQIAVLGGILAYLYERTGSLWAPIAAHMINNSIAFTLLLTGVA